MSVKKNIINKLNAKLSNEFPEIRLKIIKIVKLNIIFEIFHNISKLNSEINKFNMIDGGKKNRIIRKLKFLLNSMDIPNHNNSNVFII